jgi:Na+-translocating ferredoxin:NAD+ oxidoreductase subunit B
MFRVKASTQPQASIGISVLAARVDGVLPQTQCKRCGYDDCRSYACAVADGLADINRCPPGGVEGIRRLAKIIDRPVLALDPACGTESPRGVAIVDESWCIGCTLCIKACPVDAIVGANKRMHTVVEAQCTGCELCIPICPVTCITMTPTDESTTGWNAWSEIQADDARQRYAFHQVRVEREKLENEARLEAKAEHKLADFENQTLHTDPSVVARKKAIVEAALARAKARRSQASVSASTTAAAEAATDEPHNTKP